MRSPLSQQVRNMAEAVLDGYRDGVMDERYIGDLMAEFYDLADEVEQLERTAVPFGARALPTAIAGNVVPLRRRLRPQPGDAA